LPILAKYFDVHNDTPQGKSDYGLQKNNLKIAVIKGTENNADTTKTMGFLSQHGYNNIYVTRHDVDNSNNLPLLETQIIAQQGNVEAANMVKDSLATGKVILESIGDISSEITIIVGKDLADKL
jgi:polyisoprenyl-teichoic acid--peptidoglycan teichoic acid transferase